MDVRLYPLKFRNIFKETPWGGNRLKELYGKDTPQGKKIGESWEIVDRDGYDSVIANGSYQGTTLHRLILKRPKELFGDSDASHARFPLLVKFIDVTGRLSLQVHPDDTYAKTREEDSGKTEAWYVIRTEPGSWVVSGLRRGVSLEFFERCIREGVKEKIESCLHFLSVKAGDTIFIPPGTLHAAGNGLMLLEIQQNSDLTYRVYDWGSDRPLHLEKAMEVLKYPSPHEKIQSQPIYPPKGRGTLPLECDKFIMELLELEDTYVGRTSGFHILTFIKGSCDIYYGEGERLEADAGDNLLIPSVLKGYKINPRGSCKVVRTSVPKKTL